MLPCVACRILGEKGLAGCVGGCDAVDIQFLGNKDDSVSMRLGVSTIPSKHRCCSAHMDRYVRRILCVLRERQEEVEITVFTHAGNHDDYADWVRVLVEGSSGSLVPFMGGGGPLDKAVSESEIDVLLAPLEAPSMQSGIPQVLYAVDFSLWMGEDGRSPRKGGPDRKLLKQVCAKASSIVVPSEYLWRKCFDIFDAPLDKIVVAPPGVDEVFSEPMEAVVAQPYIVLISDALTAPALSPILEAMDKRRDEFFHTLAVVGKRCSHEPEDWGPHAVRFEQCPDTFLASLYQHCAVFLYPAQYDGSSIRVLEALQAGALVVTTSSGSVPEIGGNSPVFFNPGSMGSLLQALRRVLHENAERIEPRVREGRRTASQYSWEKCAWKVLSAIRRA